MSMSWVYSYYVIQVLLIFTWYIRRIEFKLPHKEVDGLQQFHTEQMDTLVSDAPSKTERDRRCWPDEEVHTDTHKQQGYLDQRWLAYPNRYK